MAWALDLDGVVWLGDNPVPGSKEALAKLRSRGTRVVFLTNNSGSTVSQYLDKLGRLGIEASGAELITSAQAAVSLLEPGTTALVCAGAGVVEALAERGVEPRREGPADAVVVGWHREFDFDRLTAAVRAVIGGACLIGTNDDPTYPVPGGVLPGAGSILAAVSYASGVKPEVAGKPNQAIASLLRERVGRVEVVVGDRPSTDGAFAERLGVPYALVLSGVTRRGHGPIHPEPDVEAVDLNELVDTWNP